MKKPSHEELEKTVVVDLGTACMNRIEEFKKNGWLSEAEVFALPGAAALSFLRATIKTTQEIFKNNPQSHAAINHLIDSYAQAILELKGKTH